MEIEIKLQFDFVILLFILANEDKISMQGK